MAQIFAMTQEEMDACELIRRLPYCCERDQEFIAQVALFIHLHEEKTGRMVESKSVDELLLDCLFNADYSPAEARWTDCRRIVENLFERNGFDTVGIQ